MAGNLSDYAEQKVLAQTVGKAAWAKPDLYCALYTVSPTETGGGTEVVTEASSALTGYQRVKISASDTVLYGTFSDGGATTLTVSGLTIDAWIDGVVTILTGTGAGSYGAITDNSATEITVADWVGADPSGSGIYMLRKAAPTVWGDPADGMIKNNGAYKASISYAGTWNANTNSPALVDGTGTTGTTYLVTVAGTATLDTTPDPDRTVTFLKGEYVQYDGSDWVKVTAVPYLLASDNSNGGRIEFPTALSSWGTVIAVGLVDAASGGNLIWYGTLTASKTIAATESVSFAPNDFVLSLD